MEDSYGGQFLIGAIKGRQGHNLPVQPNLFQFLIGAIKGICVASALPRVDIFQFLIGAIKGVKDFLILV